MKKDILKSSIRNTIDGILIFLLFITTTVYALPSNGVIYDNTNSGSSATNVNDALDDLYTKVNGEIDRINGIGDAGANHILNGKTAYVKGATVTGTIPSKGAATYTPGTSNQTIASGNYLSGDQTIKGDANLVAGNIKAGSSIFGVNGTYTSDANAGAWAVLSGYTAYVNGNKITGTMANRSASTVTTNAVAKDANYTYLNIPEHGYYDTNSKVKIANNDLLSNVLTVNGWIVSEAVLYHEENGGTQISRSYSVTPGHYYAVVLRLQNGHSDWGWTGAAYAQEMISVSGGTLIQKFSMGQANVMGQVVANPTGLVFVIFKATTSNVTINGIRYNSAPNVDYYLTDAIIDMYI